MCSPDFPSWLSRVPIDMTVAARLDIASIDELCRYLLPTGPERENRHVVGNLLDVAPDDGQVFFTPDIPEVHAERVSVRTGSPSAS